MNRRSAESPSGSVHPKKSQKQIHIHNEAQFVNDTSLEFTGSISDDVLIRNLPIEVIARVFRFMSLRDRLNASLVCKRWHEAGSFPLYSRNEKLVFRGFQNFETLLLFLLKTKRKFLNLEFHRCELNSSSNLLLMADKIRYLSFIDCEFGLTLPVEIFTKCVNLYEFHYKNDNDNALLYTRPSLKCFSRQVIETLEEMHFVNENLKILRLRTFSADKDMTSHNIRSIFKIFPNIKQLTFSVPHLSYYNDNISPNEFSFATVIQEIISLKHTLETLKIFALEPQLRSLALHNFTRLKEISVSMPSDIPETLIFDFFSRQQCLERISCSTANGSSFPTRFFQHLIHQCSLLKHLKLKFRVSCYIDLSLEMFNTLLSSNLITLKIINADIRPTSDQLFTTSLANNTVRVLCIPVIIDHLMQSLFIQSFKNLTFLQLQCFSGSVMESIGQFQKNLTVLKLNLVNRFLPDLAERFIRPASVWHMHQIEECLQSLACLEYLDLNFPDTATVLNCKCVPLSVKYFRVFAGYRYTVSKHLILPLKEKTALEAVDFALHDKRMFNRLYDINIWLEICCSLKKLRLLGLRSESTSEDLFADFDKHDREKETCQTLCEYCPSLRYLALKTRHSRTRIKLEYVYNHVDGKMKLHSNGMSELPGYFITVKMADSKIKFYFHV